jgi:TonB family protein
MLQFSNTAKKLWGSPRRLAGAVLNVGMLSALLALPQCGHEPSLRVRRFVPPQYPFMARVYQVEGSVTVEVEVAPDGRVVGVEGSGSNPILVEAAQRNVAQWQFEAPQKGSFPVRQTIIYEFKLEGKPTRVGLTTIEFPAPNRVSVIDQPTSAKPPEPIPPEGIPEPNDGPRLLELLRDCYSRHCENQATGPIDRVPVGKLIDCYSKHCEQESKDDH